MCRTTRATPPRTARASRWSTSKYILGPWCAKRRSTAAHPPSWRPARWPALYEHCERSSGCGVLPPPLPPPEPPLPGQAREQSESRPAPMPPGPGVPPAAPPLPPPEHRFVARWMARRGRDVQEWFERGGIPAWAAGGPVRRRGSACHLGLLCHVRTRATANGSPTAKSTSTAVASCLQRR